MTLCTSALAAWFLCVLFCAFSSLTNFRFFNRCAQHINPRIHTPPHELSNHTLNRSAARLIRPSTYLPASANHIRQIVSKACKTPLHPSRAAQTLRDGARHIIQPLPNQTACCCLLRRGGLRCVNNAHEFVGGFHAPRSSQAAGCLVAFSEAVDSAITHANNSNSIV